MSASDLVFDDGDSVLAMGRLVRDHDEWWLDSQRTITLGQRGRGPSRYSSRLIGADGHIAVLQKQDPAAAKVWLHVIGRWHEQTITVEAIAAGPGRPEPEPERPSDPPGPPPPGGWRPSSPDTACLDVDLGDLEERGVIVVASPYTKADLQHVAETFEAHRDGWHIETTGIGGIDNNGHPYASVGLFRVPRDMADWADRQPAGLLRLDPSVRPVASLRR